MFMNKTNLFCFQESDSEWDSMSGDEDIEPASISVAVNPPAKLKPDVNPPTHAPHQNLSPLPKSPLSRTNFEAKAPPRTAESYRNMINRGEKLLFIGDLKGGQLAL